MFTKIKRMIVLLAALAVVATGCAQKSLRPRQSWILRNITTRTG